ncbi:OprO/OprP family phosphate-selective porin [Sphingosinicella rhizophila]|uniref:Porin n=1 Tax=Sphingosinicella rhizophila TaxID=3050082 RepID=A0ABU3Q6B5_9SPHN|nr:porin [Sphingosinicella sp. GR2756]MDT9598956.1 porin [Sphingosinicella sp. GR2756]
MRFLLLTGASLLAFATPAYAQEGGQPTQQTTTGDEVLSEDIAESPTGGMIDTIVEDQAAAEAPPAPTGDPVLDRLNAMESRIRQLEARNAELEQAAELNEGRLQSVETKTAKNVQFSWGPTFADTSGGFTFKPRGVIEADYGAFFDRRGGYDYNNGTAFRRARIGFEGTALKVFNYRIEVDFAGNAVALTDAYLQYKGLKNLLITAGQHKAPFGLESNNSDNYNVFLERGMFTNAFGNVGAERRIGLSAAYAPKENINLAVGVFGDNESGSRSASAPDESWGFNGRATWEPIFDTGKILHLGASAFYRTELKSGDTPDGIRLSDRPNIRIDNGNIADSGVITGVESARYLGGEAAAVFGPLTLAGEYGRLWLDRPTLGDEAFDGFYAYATFFLTGETRPFKGGNFDRVKPFTEVGKDGLGAFEVALRFDRLDLANTPVLGRIGNKAESLTLGLNWYLNAYSKLLFNWVRFNGTNTPLDPIGNRTKGDVIATRLHVDF